MTEEAVTAVPFTVPCTIRSSPTLTFESDEAAPIFSTVAEEASIVYVTLLLFVSVRVVPRPGRGHFQRRILPSVESEIVG